MNISLGPSWDPDVLRNTVWEPLIKFTPRGNDCQQLLEDSPTVPSCLGLWGIGASEAQELPPSPWTQPWPGPRLTWYLNCLTTECLRNPCPDLVPRLRGSPLPGRHGQSSSLDLGWGSLLERLRQRGGRGGGLCVGSSLLTPGHWGPGRGGERQAGDAGWAVGRKHDLLFNLLNACSWDWRGGGCLEKKASSLPRAGGCSPARAPAVTLVIRINLQQPLRRLQISGPLFPRESRCSSLGGGGGGVPTGFPSRDPAREKPTPLQGGLDLGLGLAAGRRGRDGEEEGKRKTDQEAQQTWEAQAGGSHGWVGRRRDWGGVPNCLQASESSHTQPEAGAPRLPWLLASEGYRAGYGAGCSSVGKHLTWLNLCVCPLGWGRSVIGLDLLSQER